MISEWLMTTHFKPEVVSEYVQQNCPVDTRMDLAGVGKQSRFPKDSSSTCMLSNSGCTRGFVWSLCFLCRSTRPMQVDKQCFRHSQCLLDVKQQNTSQWGYLVQFTTYLDSCLLPSIFTQLANNKHLSHLIILRFQFPKHALHLRKDRHIHQLPGDPPLS